MTDRAHAAPPGTGPAGETCGTCRCLSVGRWPSGHSYRQCGLMFRTWTRGPGTMLRAKDRACKAWRAKPLET